VFNWTIDTTIPETYILTSDVNGKTSKTSAEFTFTSNRSQATFECQLDSGAWSSCSSPQQYTSLTDGSHTFRVRAVLGNNTDLTPYYQTWIVDTVAPTTSITGGPSGLIHVDSATYTFTSNESGVNFLCLTSEDPEWNPCSSPTTYDNLPEGPFSFYVKAVDEVGNNGTYQFRTLTVNTDTTPPVAFIFDGPPALTNSTSATFNFITNEDGPGSSFVCRLDNNNYEECTPPKTYTGLSEGNHTFYVLAKDPSGNWSTEKTRSWTVDTTAPTSTITSGPAQGANSNSTSATFSFTANEAGSTFQCRLDLGSWNNCTSPITYTGLANGSRGFSVRAIDPAGNVENPGPIRAWNIDTVAPETTINTGFVEGQIVPVNMAGFSFSSSEGGSTFQCQLDSGSWTACSSPQNYTSLTDGLHTFRVRAIDPSGNVDPTPAVRNWTVDTNPPNTAFINPQPLNTTGDTAFFYFNSPDDVSASFQCKLDNDNWTACQSNQVQFYTNLSGGIHTFQVRAVDSAGNVDPTPAAKIWTVDRTPPTTTITPSQGANSNSTSATFSFTANEGGSTFQCRLDIGSWTNCTSPITYTGLANGSHGFSVRATDSFGNTENPPASVTWNVDTVPPETTITVGYVEGQTVPVNMAGFSFSSSEGGSTFQCQLDSGSWTACSSPQNYTNFTDGPHTFRVRAIDQSGNVDPTPAVRNWIVDTTPPDTTISVAPNVTNGSASFTFSSPEGGVTYQCKIDNDPWESCSSPKAYSGLTEGIHTFQVRAVDAVGNADQSPAGKIWTVDLTPPTTTITGGPAQNATINTTSPAFTFTANEAGSTFRCFTSAVQSWQNCNSGQAQSGFGQGWQSFFVLAVDAVGNSGSYESRSFFIDSIAPVVTIGTITQGGAGVIRVPFSVNETSTTQCKVDNRAWFWCTTPATWDDAQLAKGMHTFYVQALDSAGNWSTVVSKNFNKT
jgi:hypothetical protein